MCDDFTDTEDAEWLAKRALSRRGFGVLGAGAGAAVLLPGCMSTAAEGGMVETTERTVTISTTDGSADAFFVHPVANRHPGVIMWPDIAGLREAYRTMARRLAGAGYAVLVPNHYYRSSAAPVVASMAEWRTPEGRARIDPMIARLSAATTDRDARAFVGFLDGQSSVDTRREIGAAGYCMTGSFAFRTAAAMPERVGAVASFHGGGLVTDKPDSPHLLIPAMRAALLVAIAQNDDAREPEAKNVLRAAADAAGRKAEIEVYPAQHGWCTLNSPVYDQVQAERAWTRMLATFAGL